MIEQKGRQTDVLRKKQREFRTGIIKQIHEKQEERINERRSKYHEGVKLEEEAKARRQRLEEAKIRKLNELRLVMHTLPYYYSRRRYSRVSIALIRLCDSVCLSVILSAR